MTRDATSNAIPAYALYGEEREFPDILHCERISARAHQHDWKISPHRHFDLHQVFLVTQGGAEMYLDGDRHKLNLPQMVSVPRHVVHGFRFAQNTEGYVLSLPWSGVARVLSAHPELSVLSKAPLITALDAGVTGVVETLHQMQASLSPVRNVLLWSHALAVLAHVADAAQSPKADRSPDHDKVAAFEKLAQEHLGEALSIVDYARILGVSPTHLGRLCHKVLGRAPSAYVQALAMQEARRLLAYTRLPIAEVGYRLGYEDPSYFSRVFRRETGVSPKTYRAKYI